MKTIPLTTEHAHKVAALHIRGIHTGFISSLGSDFVTALYEAIAAGDNSFGFAIEDDKKLLGFVAFSSNLNKLYKSIIMKKGFSFVLLLAGRIFSIKRIRKIIETLLYPARTKKANLPAAELLSIVVDSHSRHQGLGTELVQKSFERCVQMGLDKVKVLVAADNYPAKSLYRKCGFRLVSQTKSHGVVSNIYEAHIDPALDKLLQNKKISQQRQATACSKKFHSFGRKPAVRVA